MASLKAPKVPPPQITLHRAPLRLAPRIGTLAAHTYSHTNLSLYLSPHLSTHYSHYERGFRQRSIARMLDPRNLTLVARSPTSDEIVGYTQLQRLGDDGYARERVGRRWVWALGVLGWVFWAWCLVVGWVVGGDKAGDGERSRLFNERGEVEHEMYWSEKRYPERRERWYVQSCVVGPAWQGKGVGKRLMAEVVGLAQREGVPVGLEASVEGERLYRSVGFGVLGSFEQGFMGELKEVGGGHMMWVPEGWEGERGT